MERAATADEITEIVALLREALAAGALGWTTTTMPQHIGYQGRPLACRRASRQEFIAYANVLREVGRGAIEIALTETIGVLSQGEYELLDLLLTESGRPVTWLALLSRDDQPEACRRALRQADPLIRRGGIPQVTCRPLSGQLDLRKPFAFANMPSWGPAFHQPVEVQMQLYRDVAFRQAFRKELETPRVFSGRWDQVEVKEVSNPALKALEGKTVAEIAQARGKDGVDTFLDLALEDDLNLQYTVAVFNTDERQICELITDPRTMIGLSDGGAHVDMICDAGYPTYLLGTWVRDKQVMTLERAVQCLTAEPTAFFGL
jgi:N-acyl-D-aspartate/D-glutamate deacylase